MMVHEVRKKKTIPQELIPRFSKQVTSEKDIQDMRETSKTVDEKDYRVLLFLF